MHEHVTQSGERVEHEHEWNVANAPHYHFKGDADAERYGWAFSGPELEPTTSVHYPPLPDGSPDPRDHNRLERWLEQVTDLEALLKEAVATVALMRNFYVGSLECDHGSDWQPCHHTIYKAADTFLARPEIVRLKGEGE